VTLVDVADALTSDGHAAYELLSSSSNTAAVAADMVSLEFPDSEPVVDADDVVGVILMHLPLLPPLA
jgi:hypothetical protein